MTRSNTAHPHEESTTNYFKLSCLAALATAAVVALIAAAAKLIAAASLMTTSTLAAKTMLAASASASPSILPIVIGCVALIFFLSFLFGNNNTTYHAGAAPMGMHNQPWSSHFNRNSHFYTAPPFQGGNTHVHASAPFQGSNTHGHSNFFQGGNSHGHASSHSAPLHGHTSRTHGHG